MKKSTIALVALLSLIGPASAQAGSVTIPGDSGGACGPFGEPEVAYFGQTFQALPGLADQLTFTLRDLGGGEPDATEFRVLVAEWEGYDPGAVLFESGDLSFADGGGEANFAVSLGGIDLVDGNTYVVLLDAFVLFDGSDGATNKICDHSNAYTAGSFVFYNASTGDRESHFTEGWNIFEQTDMEMTLTFTECGNSTVEVGEQCDDGNSANGDCCSSACQYEPSGSACREATGPCDAVETCTGSSGQCPPDSLQPDGTSCDDASFCNGADTCAAGSCSMHAGDPCTGPDGDGDCSESCDEDGNGCTASDTDGSDCNDSNACTLGDTCSSGTCMPGSAADCDDGDLCTTDTCNESDGCHNDGVPVTGDDCYQPGKAMFLIVNANAKKMKWLWKKGEVVDPSALGTPAIDTDYALCIFDRSGGTPELVGSYSIPASASAWTVKPAMIKYIDKTGSTGGITLAKTKAPSLPGKSAFLVKAIDGNLTLPTAFSEGEFFDMDASLTVQALNSVGACWSTDFTTATKNIATKFKAVAP